MSRANITEDGEYFKTYAKKGILYVGAPGGSSGVDYGGGVLALQRLVENGDESEDTDWVSVNDTTSGSEVIMSYSSGTVADKFDFYGVDELIRVKVSDSTGPDLDVELKVSK